MPRYDPRQLNRAGMFSRSLLNRAMPTGNLLGVRGISGPNLPPGGVPLGGRVNLIGGGGPDPAATNAMGSAINRLSPRSKPTSPRTFRTGGANVSDILKNAQFGNFGAAGAARAAQGGMFSQPLGGYGQFGPQGAQAQQVQGGPDVNALAAAAGQRSAGPQDPAGPEGVLAPAQSFFGRMVGEKGSGKRSDIGRSMMQAGARMMQGSTEGTFATIGEGLEAGLGGYQALKEDRRTEEDWANKQADRERTLAAVETLKEGRTEQQQATIDAAIASGDYGKAGELAESYATDERLDEVFDESGGHYITDEYEYNYVKGLDPVARNEYMLDFITSDRARVGRATAIQQIYPGMSDEAAENLSHDAAATDRMMSRPTETQIFRGADGVGYLIDTSMNAEGDRTLDTFGPVKIDLDAQRFAAQQEAAELAGIEPQFKDIREEYQRFVPTFNGLRDYERALEKLDGEGAEAYSGPLAEIQTNISRWYRGDRAQTTEEINNILLGLGMQNLSFFRGAISEKEMEQALRKAGTTGDLKGTLREVLDSAVARQTTEMETHNARVEEFLSPHDVTDWRYWQLDPARLNQMQGESITEDLDFIEEDEVPATVPATVYGTGDNTFRMYTGPGGPG
jgi:hypothetical protein